MWLYAISDCHMKGQVSMMCRTVNRMYQRRSLFAALAINAMTAGAKFPEQHLPLFRVPLKTGWRQMHGQAALFRIYIVASGEDKR